jgi:predicted dehydrogenase
MACLTAAVVGTGFIGPVHVEALRRAGVQVAGILGSNPSKSKTAAEALQLPYGYTSFQDILNDKTVDAVHITTPNRFHFEQAQAVLKAGKHVLCEKPLAMTSCESASLVEQARTSG